MSVRPYGIYDAEYQMSARNCSTTRMITRPLMGGGTANAITSVKIIVVKKTTVAHRRTGSNICLHCRHGPIRKPVDSSDTRFPNVYMIPNATTFARNSEIVPNKLRTNPRAKQMPNPYKRWVRVRLNAEQVFQNQIAESDQ